MTKPHTPRASFSAGANIPTVIWWNNFERIHMAVEDLGCRDLLQWSPRPIEARQPAKSSLGGRRLRRDRLHVADKADDILGDHAPYGAGGVGCGPHRSVRSENETGRLKEMRGSG